MNLKEQTIIKYHLLYNTIVLFLNKPLMIPYSTEKEKKEYKEKIVNKLLKKYNIFN